jgi:protein-tyrosine phosphatase
MMVLRVVRAAGAGVDLCLSILLDAAERQAALGARAWPAEQLAAFVPEVAARGELYLAWSGEEPLGTVTLQWSDPHFWGERPDDAGYVHKLAVPRTAAGRGAGEALLGWAEEQVVAAGRSFVRLDCDADNPRINAYYRAAGFVLAGVRTFPDGSRWSLYEKRVRTAG